MSSLNPINHNTPIRDANYPIPVYNSRNAAPRDKPEYCHSKGVRIGERGPYESYPTREKMSAEYRGPGFYTPFERNWIKFMDKRDIPLLWKPDLIEMKDEPTWVNFQEYRDRPRYDLGRWDQPNHIPFGLSVPTIQGNDPDVLERVWDGAGTFSPATNKWLREHEYTAPGLPPKSVLFYNEEDWMKYKFYAQQPWLDTEIKE